MKSKLFYLLWAISAHTIIGFLSGSLGWEIQYIVVLLTGFIVIWLTNHRYPNKPLYILLILAPFYIVYTFSSVYLHSWETYPIWIAGLVSAIITLILIKQKQYIPALVWIILITASGYIIVFPNHFANLYAEKNLDRFHRIDQAVIKDESGKAVDLSQLKNKVILIDIWHRFCAPCIKKFKDLENLQKQYSYDSAVKIFSLNIPFSSDDYSYSKKITDKYSFENLYFGDSIEHKKIGVDGVPLVLIYDKNLKCRYAGDLNTGWNIFIGNAETIIENLKSE